MGVIVNRVPRDANDVWKVARWAYESMRATFERANALDGLHLHLLEDGVAERARRILLDVATRGATGDQ
jgi:hypothetical protein